MVSKADEKREYHRQYYHKHKHKYQKKVMCKICKKKIAADYINKHKKTKYHKKRREAQRIQRILDSINEIENTIRNNLALKHILEDEV